MGRNYRGKKIVIVGLGLTGFSCVHFFLSRGIIPRVMDTRISPPGINKLPMQVERYLGGLNDNWIFTADLIVVSPSITLMYPAFSAAANAGVEIISDIELFCREAQAPIIAITGSNGKSTVATLISEMAKSVGINVGIGGNIGFPALSLLDPTYDLYVLELSSFQLETTYSLQPTVATILNITEDHINRYPSGLLQYRAVKLRIYNQAKVCVVNANDVLTKPSVYSSNKKYISFGTNTGDYHLSYQNGETWLQVKNEKILNVKKLSIIGQHNYVNALAALALADVINLPRYSVIKTLTQFTGLAHRLQIVLENNGVRWINDSKATNIGSTKAALKGLHVDGILHLLIGGDGKSANFSLLKPHLKIDKMRLYCFGHSKNELAELCPEISEKTDTLKQAMYLLASRVRPGDVALLSPACASFDQFKNFEHRGLLFAKLAKELG